MREFSIAWDELITTVTQALAPLKGQTVKPDDHAAVVVASLRQQLAGARVYYPVGAREQAQQRDAAIVSEWKSGKPIPEIATDRKMTTKAVYGSLRRSRRQK